MERLSHRKGWAAWKGFPTVQKTPVGDELCVVPKGGFEVIALLRKRRLLELGILISPHKANSARNFASERVTRLTLREGRLVDLHGIIESDRADIPLHHL
jgi:hypothetical protein